MRDPNNPCLFCNISNNDFELENELANSFSNSKSLLDILQNKHGLLGSLIF